MTECAFDLTLIDDFSQPMTAMDMANLLREKQV